MATSTKATTPASAPVVRRRDLRPAFDSGLQFNVHIYVPVPDGAFDHDGVFFVAHEAIDDNDVREIMVSAATGGSPTT